jgi:hypothetical protein
MESEEKGICKWGFHSCGNYQYNLCGDCEEGSNYEYFQDANTYDGNYFDNIKEDEEAKEMQGM